MELSILFIILFLISRNKGYSIASQLIGIYLISLVGMYLLSPSIFMGFNIGFFDVVFLSVFFSLMVLPWRKMKLKAPINLFLTKRDYKLYKIYKYLGVICFVVNVTVLIVLQQVVTDYSAFKNGGEASDYVKYIPIPHVITLAVSWFSRTYLFLLPFHFFYLKNNNIRESMIAFLLSFNYVLVGLAGFSRSSFISFILIYVVLFIYFYRTISKDIIRHFSKYLVISIVGFLIFFIIITLNRFAGDAEFVALAFLHDDSVIANPIINSQISYLSQWYEYSVKYLPHYSSVDLTYGVRSLPLLFFILQKMGLSNAGDELINVMSKQFGESDAGSFMGIGTNLIFDVGYFFTLILVVFYSLVVKKIANKSNCSIIEFMPIVILIELPATGIFNSCMNGMGWHISILLYFIYKKLL